MVSVSWKMFLERSASGLLMGVLVSFGLMTTLDNMKIWLEVSITKLPLG